MVDLAPPFAALLPRALRITSAMVLAPVAVAMAGGARVARKVGIGGISDRRLKVALDLPVLTHDPAETAITETRTQIAGRIAANRWADAYALIRGWDQSRAATPFGDRLARIGCEAALARLTGALAATTPAKAAQAQAIADAVLDGFEDRLAATPADPVAAALAALAHIACGWAARGNDWAANVSDEGWDRMALHYARAQEILDAFDPAEWNSPLLAEAHYRLCPGVPDGAERLRDAHDDWADLDPSDRRVWESHGLYLLPRWFGCHAEVAAAAARCEWQTERWLGKGGYALFLLPVLAAEPALWNRIDPESLAASALDLARHRRKDQAAVNRIARAMLAMFDDVPPEYAPLLRTAYRQLLEESLHALVPAAWGTTESAARRAIAQAFHAELRAGACLRATSAGLALCDGSAA